MVTLSTLPDVVDIEHYAGDTLTIMVTAPEALVTGREWAAQIRPAKGSSILDAEFVITPPATPGGPAYLVLPGAESARLVSGGPVIQKRRGSVSSFVAVYSGFWDVQVAAPGEVDPITTLARGSISFEMDVTRDEG